ncbi:14015_t:CDS:1, partial [Funneliformis caledonium]
YAFLGCVSFSPVSYPNTRYPLPPQFIAGQGCNLEFSECKHNL